MDADHPLAGEDIVCFAGEDWWFHNPHSNYHIMRQLARSNRVLFVNSIGIRVPSLTSDKFVLKRIFHKLASMARYLRRAEPNVYVLTPIACPPIRGWERLVERLNFWLLRVQLSVVLSGLKFKRPILWVTSPAVTPTVLDLRRRGAKLLVYYCVDNYAHYPGVNADYIRASETILQQHADLALYVNHRLMEERQGLARDARYLSHGVDYDHFAHCQDPDSLAVPADLAKIPRPMVGYMGEIQSVDFDLIRFLAEKNSGMSFVFIGEVYEDLARNPLPPNVHFLGKRPYRDLPGYLGPMACCCLYYRTDEPYNNYRNPKKLLEYLATGKPIVSVPIDELNYFKDTVSVANDREEFNTYLRQAVAQDDPAAIRRRMDWARAHTWEAVALQAGRYMAEKLTSVRETIR